MGKIRYGAAYYDEYLPQDQDRLERDMERMAAAGMNVIRIAESTWSSQEPEEGVFDFSHVTRTIEAAARHDISVIVGTPTYAVPPWLAAKHPDILAVTENGAGKYGTRQNMDLTSPDYLFYAERIIRRLMEAVQGYDNVVGFQLDNETKHYHTAGARVQKQFAEHLKREFGTVEAMNRAFGFAYWSNRVDCWEHLPDVTGTINASYLAEFEKFRRKLVADFLLWQRKLVDEYRRPEQFVTHNFDFAWRDYSFGLQPEADPFLSADAVTKAGCDIYHLSQDRLTGKEASFCGAIARALKDGAYLVLETQAQGQVEWTPFDGQLRLQAFSHLANGAEGVLYWHWNSIHHSFETYWRGVLGHDMRENRIYREAVSIGADLERLGGRLLIQKRCRAAIVVSNESLTALSRRPFFPLPDGVQYNDIVRAYHDALYELNVECDVLPASVREKDAGRLRERLSRYDLVVVPGLYSAAEETLLALKDYVRGGGYLVMTYRSGYADGYLGVYADEKPYRMRDCFGMTYQEYTVPEQTSLRSERFSVSAAGRACSVWMELLMPDGAETLASYEHPCWGQYSAITRNRFGKGTAVYVGCHLTPEYTRALMRLAAQEAGVLRPQGGVEFPLVIRSGKNELGRTVHYYFNFSGRTLLNTYVEEDAAELLTGREIRKGAGISLSPWSVAVFEERDASS